MGFKRVIRKAAKLVLASSPEKFVNVEVAQVSAGNVLKGKTVVITGGGRGLGLAMAEKFISEGAKVVISGRKEETLKAACEKLGSCDLCGRRCLRGGARRRVPGRMRG